MQGERNLYTYCLTEANFKQSGTTATNSITKPVGVMQETKCYRKSENFQLIKLISDPSTIAQLASTASLTHVDEKLDLSTSICSWTTTGIRQ